jgi:hypothetical protein
MARRRKNETIHVDDPLRHADHARPRTRRDFLRQGFLTGTGTVIGGGVFSLFANPRAAFAEVAPDLQALADSMAGSSGYSCTVGGLTGDVKIPFMCFDLAGGANFAGSNVLMGGPNGQMDFLSTGGYSKLGLPGDIIPGLSDTGVAANMLNASDGDFTNSELGLRFHSDSPMLSGILEKFSTPLTEEGGGVDGCIIAARSDNDTGNNPHNPMYAIAQAGAAGGVVDLIGSRSSVSGGNSMSPAMYINNEIRPTKVDRPSDVTGMVDVGNLTGILRDPVDVTAVMESMARISHKKMSVGNAAAGFTVTPDEVVKDLVRCGYIKAADIAERFAGVEVSPDDRNATTPVIVSDTNGIFTEAEFDGDGEFRKTASVMKMVVDGHAGAGCVTMGGYDYHTGDRFVGENRDLRAGRCIGAALAYAARMGKPLMVYVFSDGSLASNGNLDNSAPMGNNELGGRGKGQWTGDNSSTASSFFLVYDPNNGLSAFNPADTNDRQIGWFSNDASVATTSHRGANNVNLLVNTVVLNYMALNGDQAQFDGLFPSSGLGDITQLIKFNALA